jgi:hypothetical protein
VVLGCANLLLPLLLRHQFQSFPQASARGERAQSRGRRKVAPAPPLVRELTEAAFRYVRIVVLPACSALPAEAAAVTRAASTRRGRGELVLRRPVATVRELLRLALLLVPGPTTAAPALTPLSATLGAACARARSPVATAPAVVPNLLLSASPALRARGPLSAARLVCGYLYAAPYSPCWLATHRVSGLCCCCRRAAAPCFCCAFLPCANCPVRLPQLPRLRVRCWELPNTRWLPRRLRRQRRRCRR